MTAILLRPNTHVAQEWSHSWDAAWQLSWSQRSSLVPFRHSLPHFRNWSQLLMKHTRTLPKASPLPTRYHDSCTVNCMLRAQSLQFIYMLMFHIQQFMESGWSTQGTYNILHWLKMSIQTVNSTYQAQIATVKGLLELE